MRCENCGEPMKVERSESIRDKDGKEVGKMTYYVCKNNHVKQVPKKK